jgi:hypothetical protein
MRKRDKPARLGVVLYDGLEPLDVGGTIGVVSTPGASCPTAAASEKVTRLYNPGLRGMFDECADPWGCFRRREFQATTDMDDERGKVRQRVTLKVRAVAEAYEQAPALWMSQPSPVQHHRTEGYQGYAAMCRETRPAPMRRNVPEAARRSSVGASFAKFPCMIRHSCASRRRSMISFIGSNTSRAKPQPMAPRMMLAIADHIATIPYHDLGHRARRPARRPARNGQDYPQS